MRVVDPGSLRGRVLSAGAWSLGGYGFTLVIRFGCNLWMTRLLAPEMFGAMAIASSILIGLGLISDLGVKLTVVQSQRGDETHFLNTAWTIQILRGLLIWAVALLFSLCLKLAVQLGMLDSTNSYAIPYLPEVIAAISFVSIISGFESTKVLGANRQLALGAITSMEVVSQLFGLAVMLVWASFDRSIWALVASSLAAALARTLISHLWIPGRPNRLGWDPTVIKELVSFGKWTLVSSLLGFAVNNGDRLILASLVGPVALGIYTIAASIYGVVEQLLNRLMSDVAFPAFGEVARNHRSQMRSTYYKFFVVVGALSYFLSGALVSSSETLVRLLFDPRYQDAGWMLQVLALSILTLPFRLITQALLALGLPHLLTYIIAVRLAAMFPLMILGNQYFGVAGAVWGVVLSQFVYLPIMIFYGVRLGLLDWKRELIPLPFLMVGLAVGNGLTMWFGH